MSNEINWANLVAKNRAKAFGVPWSDEENRALQAGVPADFVREGVLTVEDYQAKSKAEEVQQNKTGEKPVARMNLGELKEKATSLGLEFTPDATKAALVEIINAKVAATAEGEGDEDKTGGPEAGNGDGASDKDGK